MLYYLIESQIMDVEIRLEMRSLRSLPPSSADTDI